MNWAERGQKWLRESGILDDLDREEAKRAAERRRQCDEAISRLGRKMMDACMGFRRKKEGEG